MVRVMNSMTWFQLGKTDIMPCLLPSFTLKFFEKAQFNLLSKPFPHTHMHRALKDREEKKKFRYNCTVCLPQFHHMSFWWQEQRPLLRPVHRRNNRILKWHRIHRSDFLDGWAAVNKRHKQINVFLKTSTILPHWDLNFREKSAF